jgi:hypothetical protein
MSVQKDILLCLDLLVCLMTLKELVAQQDSSGLIRTAGPACYSECLQLFE